MDLLSEEQRAQVLDQIDQKTPLIPYLRLARDKNIWQFFLDHTKLENVLLKRFSPSKEEKMWNLNLLPLGQTFNQATFLKPLNLAITPVTQLQFTLVLGNNPSHFIKDGIKIVVDGKEIQMHPNHPVESVSYQEASEFNQRLSEFDGSITSFRRGEFSFVN